MTKKFFTLIFAVSLFIGAKAQSFQLRKDTTIVESTDRYKFETNKFFGNWFIGAGAGAQIYFGDHNDEMKFGDRITPAFNFYIGKWFTPGIGVRAGYTGFKVKGLTQNGSHSDGTPYSKLPWEGYWLTNQEFKYNHVHGDAMFNLMNIFGGYKQNRFYELIPYAGLGWMWTKSDAKNPQQREVSANIGVYNTFRLGNSFGLTLDVRGAMVNDRFDGEEGERRNEGPLSATLGLVYKIKQNSWKKSETVTIGYDEAQLRSLVDRVNALASDNAALKTQLANAKTEVITDIKVENRVIAAPVLLTFPINKSTVSNEARVNLGFLAKVIKQTNANVVYTITGYADSGTGSPKTNERLSKERAEAIYNVLVKEFNVNPSQLRTIYKGGVDNMYYDDPRLSRAVITIAEGL